MCMCVCVCVQGVRELELKKGLERWQSVICTGMKRAGKEDSGALLPPVAATKKLRPSAPRERLQPGRSAKRAGGKEATAPGVEEDDAAACDDDDDGKLGLHM
jgi:hypothetical protein